MTLKEEKIAARKTIAAARDAMSAAARTAASVAILDAVSGDPAYRAAKMILAYCGFGSELETAPFLEATLARGKMLALPRIHKPTRSLRLYRVTDLDADLQAGPWGIMEPKARDDRAVEVRDIGFVLMPGLGFDPHCNRLGYGAGFYDSLFGAALAQGAALPARIAGAFDCQVTDSIPVGEHDLPVDAVVTETARYSREAQTA